MTEYRLRRFAGTAAVAMLVFTSGCADLLAPSDLKQEQDQNFERAKRLKSKPDGFAEIDGRPGPYKNCDLGSLNYRCTDVTYPLEGSERDPLETCRSVLSWAIEMGQTKYLEATSSLSEIDPASFTEELNTDSLDALTTRCAAAFTDPQGPNVMTGTAMPSTAGSRASETSPAFVYTELFWAGPRAETDPPRRPPWSLYIRFAS